MICKLCGAGLSKLSHELDYCTRCGAKYIAFNVYLKTGLLYERWGENEILGLEAEIGRSMFQPEFEATHQTSDLSGDDLSIVRIRALRLMLAKLKEDQG